MILSIEALLQAGADPLALMQDSITSLHIAAANGLPDVLSALLNAIKHRKEVSKFRQMVEKNQKDPLMLSIERGNPSCAVLLV